MEMRQMTKIILAHELLEQGISKTRIAERLQVSRRTVIRWAQAIEQYGDLETYNEQAFIESFNRSLRKECLGWAKY
jgi:transposase